MNKRFSNGRATGRLSAALTAALLGCLSVAPAQAQYNFNGNMGYMAQNTLLYPLSRLFNVPYNYNVLNPYYLLQMGAGTTAQNYYGNFRAPGYGAMPGVPAPFGFGRNGANKNLQAGFTPDDPDTQQPGTLTSGPSQSMAQTGLLMPQLNGRGAGSAAGLPPTATMPTTAYTPSAATVPQSIPQSVQASSFGTPSGMQPGQGFQPAQSQAQSGYSMSNILPPRQTVSSDMPPVAPSRHGSASSTKHSKHSRADQQASTAGQQSGQQVAGAPNMVPSRESTAPLAAGFVELVNAKYDGDIGKALFNTDTRAWAHAVGLVDNEQMFGADLSQSRISLMSGIMKDPNLDPVSKLDAVKILLRGATTANPVAGH